jgi:hypothetical protein
MPNRSRCLPVPREGPLRNPGTHRFASIANRFRQLLPTVGYRGPSRSPVPIKHIFPRAFLVPQHQVPQFHQENLPPSSGIRRDLYPERPRGSTSLTSAMPGTAAAGLEERHHSGRHTVFGIGRQSARYQPPAKLARNETKNHTGLLTEEDSPKKTPWGLLFPRSVSKNFSRSHPPRQRRHAEPPVRIPNALAPTGARWP